MVPPPELWLLFLFLSFASDVDFESLVASLSVVEYDPDLNPFELPSLVEDELLESVLLDVLLLELLLLLFEKLPDLKPSLLFELVLDLLVEFEVLVELLDELDEEPLLEDLLVELLTDPDLNPLLDFELLDRDDERLLELDFDLLAACTVVFSFKPIPVIERMSKGKLEKVNIKVKSKVIICFLLILWIVSTP